MIIVFPESRKSKRFRRSIRRVVKRIQKGYQLVEEQYTHQFMKNLYNNLDHIKNIKDHVDEKVQEVTNAITKTLFGHGDDYNRYVLAMFKNVYVQMSPLELVLAYDMGLWKQFRLSYKLVQGNISIWKEQNFFNL